MFHLSTSETLMNTLFVHVARKNTCAYVVHVVEELLSGVFKDNIGCTATRTDEEGTIAILSDGMDTGHTDISGWAGASMKQITNFRKEISMQIPFLGYNFDICCSNLWHLAIWHTRLPLRKKLQRCSERLPPANAKLISWLPQRCATVEFGAFYNLYSVFLCGKSFVRPYRVSRSGKYWLIVFSVFFRHQVPLSLRLQ